MDSDEEEGAHQQAQPNNKGKGKAVAQLKRSRYMLTNQVCLST
jgi:hypothetical protein